MAASGDELVRAVSSEAGRQSAREFFAKVASGLGDEAGESVAKVADEAITAGALAKGTAVVAKGAPVIAEAAPAVAAAASASAPSAMQLLDDFARVAVKVT